MGANEHVVEMAPVAADPKNAWLTPAKSPLRELDMPVLLDGETETWVTIRELTANRIATINEAVVTNNRQKVRVDQKRRSAMVFCAGCINPTFTEMEAMQIAELHGASFSLVVAAIDDLSGVSDDALDIAKARFRPRPRR